MPVGRNPFLFLLIPLFLLGSAGCETLTSKERIKKQKELVELKKKHFSALRQDILTKKVADGITSEKIKEEYGEPDDVFFSGSNSSRFEIWTYEFITTGDNREENPIRLYFANNKLINLSY